MKKDLKKLSVVMVGVFLISYFLTSFNVAAQDEETERAVRILTLANGTSVEMTWTQLVALTAQPGVTLSTTSAFTAIQIAIPVPASLGGGFIVGEPAAIAAAMNTLGIASGLTGTSFAGATAAVGSISVGSVAGEAMTAGISAGTIALGVVLGAAAIGGAIALGGGGGGGGGGGSTPSHH